MPCGCNSICDHDCSSNNICTGHVPACSNTFTLTSISQGDIVLAAHILELHEAIDTERKNGGRRFTASDPDYCTTHTPGDVACSNNNFNGYVWSGGIGATLIVEASHFDDVKDANNEVNTNSGYGGVIGADFPPVDDVIYASAITEMQTKINQTRNVCICDSHCNCNPGDCGCDGECPSDDYYSYYYP
jgi:hypothetical protein